MKTSYTFANQGSQFILTDINNSDNYIHIDTNHPKYTWLASQESNRLININSKGHWNSSKDYHNAYGTQTPNTNIPQPKTPTVINLTKLDDLNIDDSLFIPMATDTVFDKFISSEGGFLPGTNVMMVGMPGTGKCVRHNTMIEVRNKNTGETIELTIKEFHELNR